MRGPALWMCAAIAAIQLLSGAYAQGSGSGDVNGLQDIRLVNQTGGSFTGRVEVLYRGQWGTICDNYWSYSDAKVACIMLGFRGAVCAVSRAQFGRGTGQIWMSNLQCRGYEDSLEDCSFRGWGLHTCVHSEDAGVVCATDSALGAPINVRLLESSTTSLTIGWETPREVPKNVNYMRYRVMSTRDSDGNTYARYVYPGTGNSFNTTLTSLNRATAYSVKVRAEVRFSYCYSYLYGNYSEDVAMTTNSTVKKSDLKIRLVPPSPDLPFMGRLEVLHNGQWGTVCDDYFSYQAAQVVCGMLNYTRRVCAVTGGRLGQGTGQIWLDNVRCSSGDEVLEDCSYNAWGVHNCDHGDDVGVICDPGDVYQVEDFTVSRVGSTSVTVKWKPVNFPAAASITRYRIQYKKQEDSYFRYRYVYPPRREYTLTRLQFGATYNISIRVELRFSYCYSYLYGEYSDYINATTRESAPTGPPTAFHVVVLNSTAIEVQWGLPALDDRNGIIRGYKVFLHRQGTGGSVLRFNVQSNDTNELIVSGLQPSTGYVCSVLAYTVADGPRSVRLTAVTRASDFIPFITKFGIYGNGIDKVRQYSYGRTIRVLCGSSVSGVSIDWYFSNGTKVGITNRQLREAHYANGTAVLEIGLGRRLNLCDAGTYVCVANKSDGGEHRREFILVINSSPPAPSRATPVHIGSTWVQLRWSEANCDGGHRIQSFTIEYSDDLTTSSYYRSNYYIRNIDGALRTYTVTGLQPNTEYTIRVQSVSAESQIAGTWSPSNIIVTLPPAPSSPRDVRVRLVSPKVVEVSWEPPAVPNGHIVHYNIYGLPLVAFEPVGRTKRQASADLPGSFRTVAPGSARSFNVTVPETSTTYQFQVSASVYIAGEENEGNLSSITPTSTIHVPLPGLPVARDVRVQSMGNASITLIWTYPPPPVETIAGFKVSYSGSVTWVSRGGMLVQFLESGELQTDYTSLTVRPLTPETNYQFKVSALTEKGEGAEVVQYGRTSEASGGKLAYFHIRVGPITDCLAWHDEDSSDKLSHLRLSLVNALNILCGCSLTDQHISDEELSCRGGLRTQIVYRGRVKGSDHYSADDLVGLLQSWANTGEASVMVGVSRLDIDPTCPIFMDNINAADCAPPLPTDPPKPTDRVEPQADKGHDDMRSGEVGGIVIGAVIAALFLTLIVLVAILLWRRWKPTGHKEEGDKAPFANLDEVGSARDSVAFDTPEPPTGEKDISNL